MKLRIRGNSIRLRLLRNEVAALEEEGSVTERCVFGPDSALRFTIKVSDVNELSSAFEENEVKVEVPRSLAKEWFETELVGFDSKIPNGEDNLSILVEKDFVCLTRTDDPDNDNAYPNPEEDAC